MKGQNAEVDDISKNGCRWWTKRNNFKSKRPKEISKYEYLNGVSNKLD